MLISIQSPLDESRNKKPFPRSRLLLAIVPPSVNSSGQLSLVGYLEATDMENYFLYLANHFLDAIYVWPVRRSRSLSITTLIYGSILHGSGHLGDRPDIVTTTKKGDPRYVQSED